MKKTPVELLHRFCGATHAEIAFLAKLGHGNDLGDTEMRLASALARVLEGNPNRSVLERQLQQIATKPWTPDEVDRGQRSLGLALRRWWGTPDAALNDFEKRTGLSQPQILQRHQIAPLPPEHSCDSTRSRLRSLLLAELAREPAGFPGFAIPRRGKQWHPWFLNPRCGADPKSLPLDWRGYLIPMMDERQRTSQFMRVLPYERKERRYRTTALKGQLPDHPYHVIRDVHRSEAERVEHPRVLVIQEKVLGGICFLELYVAHGLQLFGDRHPWIFCWMGVDMSAYAAARVVQYLQPERVIIFLDRNSTIPESNRQGEVKRRVAERLHSLILRLCTALEAHPEDLDDQRILVHRWTPEHAEGDLQRKLNGPDDLLVLGLALTEESFCSVREWMEIIRSTPELAGALDGDPEVLRGCSNKIEFGGSP